MAPAPRRSSATRSGHRYGCATRRCHATNPHGADSSKYKLFAAKLLFNESANDDLEGDGTYGGLDAVWDDMGATDAAVERFVSNNTSIMSTTAAGDILIHGVAPDANETHALVAGLTCGRPSNPSTGEDECHAEASYAIVDKGIKENRNHVPASRRATPIAPTTPAPRLSATAATTTATPRPATSPVRSQRFRALPPTRRSPAARAATIRPTRPTPSPGNFTFPHGQSAAGATNLYLPTASRPLRRAATSRSTRACVPASGPAGRALSARTASSRPTRLQARRPTTASA